MSQKSIRINSERCTGCGRCVSACNSKLLSLELCGNRKTSVLAVPQRCSLCLRCIAECPFEAITLKTFG